MAGQISSLFESPTLCSLSGISLQARPAIDRPDFLYAAVYFNTITSLVPDAVFRERWECTDCTCHISITQNMEMPGYDRGIVYRLRQAFKRWKTFQDSVRATLLYVPLGEWTDPQSRIVLDTIPDRVFSIQVVRGVASHSSRRSHFLLR